MKIFTILLFTVFLFASSFAARSAEASCPTKDVDNQPKVVTCKKSTHGFARGGCALAQSKKPEGWVRAWTKVDREKAEATWWLELESDSADAGPCGRALVSLKDTRGKEIAKIVMSKRACRGGKRKPKADQDLQRVTKVLKLPCDIAQATASVEVKVSVKGKKKALGKDYAFSKVKGLNVERAAKSE